MGTTRTKPISEATRAMLDAMEQDAAAAPEADRLATIHRHVAELREAELDKSRLETELKSVNVRINDLLWSKIPQVMDEAMVPSVTIAAEGNKPPYTVEVVDHYKANIPEERAPEAYDYLRSVKAQDLIKTQYVISFGLGESRDAARFERSLEKAGILYDVKQGVPWNTLTAWFREEYRRRPMPAKIMEILGATVGRVAKVAKHKEKK